MEARTPKLFVVAGEPSGDQLGGKLIAALKAATGGNVQIEGVGGEAMSREGLVSLFPMSDIAVMGPSAILKRLPLLRRRGLETVAGAIAAEPDAIVIIDSPEFTHRVAARVRKKRPDIPIIDYVSPSVWAWRPGRARKMKPYVDHVLALLPFEPGAHERLGGPKCSYVGHPLVERLAWMDALDGSALAGRLGLKGEKQIVAVLPGSRPNEVGRLMDPFNDALKLVEEKAGKNLVVLMPVVSGVRALVEEKLKSWERPVHLLEGEDEKFQSFRLAKAALAASGTVTLELALAGTPMVVAYRVEAITAMIGRLLIHAQSAVLANLVLEENAFPEFLQEDCTPANLAGALAPLLSDSAERAAQLDALGRIRNKMALEEETPSAKAAKIVLDYARAGRPES